MSCNSDTPNLNKTFIIEPLSITGGSPTLSACTALYSNSIESCSGDTVITMGTDSVVFNSNITGVDGLTANTITSNDFYSGSTNLIDVMKRNDIYISGGTFNASNDTLTLNRNDDVNVDITGVTNFNVDVVRTTDDTLTPISVFNDISSNRNVFLVNYITSYGNEDNYGFWKRTLVVNNTSGIISIKQVIFDIDTQSSGLTPYSVDYYISGTSIVTQVIGEVGLVYNWESKWEII